MDIEKIKATILELKEELLRLGRVGEVWITMLALMAFALVFACLCLGNLSVQEQKAAKEAISIDDAIASTQEETFAYLSKLEKQIQAGETDYKLCYFTFDDGPYANTYEVLKILDDNDVQATFFVTSINGDYCFDDKTVETKPIYQEYTKYGHTIGNHTYTHGIFKGLYDSTESFMNGISKQEQFIFEQTGIRTNICRFPGGMGSAGSLREPIQQALRKKGYGWVDWSCDTGDGGRIESTEAALNKFLKTFGDTPIEVVLMHDYSKKTTAMLSTAIAVAREKNYILAPLFYDSVAIKK